MAGRGERKQACAENDDNPATQGGQAYSFVGGLNETLSVPSGRAVRPEAASSVAPIANHYRAPCVLASERPSHPDDEQGSVKPS